MAKVTGIFNKENKLTFGQKTALLAVAGAAIATAPLACPLLAGAIGAKMCVAAAVVCEGLALNRAIMYDKDGNLKATTDFGCEP